ncbi:hypothetical protein E2C01_059047 [Portunus trituberculatus]|uniref:Uncharacterized protein n=1 Tax=Portunus trituberculatus TaxID=210409 RepID=A0A5B7H5S7_PORTR|nr:hypothetical protein [Portunus trituberculatus]
MFRIPGRHSNTKQKHSSLKLVTPFFSFLFLRPTSLVNPWGNNTRNERLAKASRCATCTSKELRVFTCKDYDEKAKRRTQNMETGQKK